MYSTSGTGTAITVTGRESPQGWETSRFQHFLQTVGSELAVRLSAQCLNQLRYRVPPYVQSISKVFKIRITSQNYMLHVYNKLRLNNVRRSSLLSGTPLKYSDHIFCRQSGVILSTRDIKVRFLLNVRNSLKIKLYDQKTINIQVNYLSQNSWYLSVY
jgi:hypothetical protein